MTVGNRVKIIIAIAGLISVVIGLGLQFLKPISYIETQGIIDRIEIRNTSQQGQQYKYDVYITYFVDDQEYNELLGYYSPDYTEGMTVRVYYDPADPEIIHGDDMSFSLYYVVVGLLLLWLALCLVILPSSKPRQKARKSLKNNE